ncbi:hypothetical protein M408DRAFT_334275 [Serendipita vermifera MAFF 305830]|uniref:DUF6593 domain-containing protein n=1 Tax=Serendipita vermifera MAFF 305830 TaxID=933852 RepID=A0A0C3A520_SERVB|nr:hypothetical protein M408DRAFT_334275 [Serendipita vermifera MAFF 305830]
MSVHLYFANNSVRNTTISCDSLGIHYTVSKAEKIVSLSRWDVTANSNVVVGEFELPSFRKDRIKVGPMGQWQPMRNYFDKPGMFSTSMTFTSNNGMKYTWKEHHGHLIMTHSGNKNALIKYHRHVSKSSYLDVLDSSTMTGLDAILLTFLIAERKKRDNDEAGGEIAEAVAGA